MLNFRYHLVSLIAVFAALAIGVVLGAGPLQSRLADSLRSTKASTNEVDAQALTQVTRIAHTDAQGLISLADERLKGTLTGTKVALVSLPGANAEDSTMVSERLQAAGAEVVGSAALTSNWESSAMAKYRETLATPLAAHLSSLPSDASSEAVIGYAIVAALTSTGPETALVQEILTDDSTPILSINTDPAGSATAIVVVGARDSSQSQDADQSAGSVASPRAWSGLARALPSAPKSGVIIGDAHDSTSMVASIREAGDPVTTIDSPGTALGAVSAAAALKDASASARAFGSEPSAESLMPTLP